MENAIQTVFNLIRPFLVAGILTVFCYRIITAIVNQDAKQAFRLLTWGFAFAIGFILVDVSTGIKSGGSQELISCLEMSHIANCNGWIFYGSSGKGIAGLIEYLAGSDIFSTANATIIMSVAGLILVLELTKAVWQAAAPPIVAAFFTGCVVYVILTNPGYILTLISEFLAVGTSSSYDSNVATINTKLGNIEALLDGARAVDSTKGIMQTVSDGFNAPLKYLIEILLSLALGLLSILNAVFLILGALVLSWLPNLVLFSLVMGAFTKWTPVRWIGYISCLKLIVICQIWVLTLLPTVNPQGSDFMDMLAALAETSSALIGTLILIVLVVGVLIWGGLKVIHLIWLREIMPAAKMAGALKDNFGSVPMDRYF